MSKDQIELLESSTDEALKELDEELSEELLKKLDAYVLKSELDF